MTFVTADNLVVDFPIYGGRSRSLKTTLMRALAEALGGTVAVESTALLGVAPNRVEALAFAWLGYCFTQRLPGNLAAVTGAKGPRVLGALYPA